MDPRRLRLRLRIAAAVSLTGVAAASVLYVLLSRLDDAVGAWWAARFGAASAVVCLAALTAICLTADAVSDPDSTVR